MSLQQAWAELLVDALAASGVRDVVISPGSRSTPFVLAAHRHGDLLCHDVMDERAAGFFALGQARVTGRPGVLLCTSGSAPAHYLPAVIEASQSFVPLVVLSADRPAELHGCGANQTVDQTSLFGAHVRRFTDLGAADAREEALRAVRRAAVQAVATSLGPTPGPVHMNARARKPLEPDEGEPSQALARRIEAARAEARTRVYAPRPSPSEAAVRDLADACRGAARGVIVAGPAPLSQSRARDAVHALVEATGYPLLAEATSQLRFGGERGPRHATVDAFDAIYRSATGRARLRPDVVVQLGAAPVSAGLERLLAQGRDLARWVVAPHGWPDPHGRARAMLDADVGATARGVAEALEGDGLAARAERAAYRDALVAADARAWAQVERALGRGFGEGEVARTLAGALPEGAALVVGNSAPVRQLDLWCPGASSTAAVVSQRGASGIDGMVAGAAGAASQWGGPCAALLGDVAFLHDAGSLAVACRLARPLVIVVAANDGGRIFEQLPIGARVDLRDAMPRFTTPHGLSAARIAEGYGVEAARVETADALRAHLSEGLSRPRCTVIEAVVPPQGASQVQHALWEAVDASLRETSA